MFLSGKMDELMKLFASKSAPIDRNDIPLSNLIENNNNHGCEFCW